MAKRHVRNTQAQLLGDDADPRKRGVRKPNADSPVPRHAQTPSQSLPPKRHRGLLIGFVVTLALIVAGVVALFLIDPPLYFVSVNGQRELVTKNITIADLIAQGKVTPVPGDLIAIDGSVAQVGAGQPFHATVDGTETTDPATRLAQDATLEITDGADVDEGFTEGEEPQPSELEPYDEDPSAYYEGPFHLFTHGSEGLQSYRLGDVSGIKLTETIEPAIPSTYSILSVDPDTTNAIALTFDDGPWPETTGKILDILAANNARATFFTIGSQVNERPDVVARAHALGCQVATHSWDHAAGSGGGTNLVAMSPEEQIAEVEDGFAAIAEAIGEEPSRVMRAPGGNFYGDLVRNIEPYIDAEIGWNIDSMDWSRPGVDAIYQQIMFVRPGQVVLLHDGGGDRSQTVEAVAKAVPELIKKGYRLVTVDELIEELVEEL